jgi:hypothetical protein
VGERQGGAGLGVTRSARTSRQGRSVGPGISAILDDVKRRQMSILVPRPRQALDGTQYGGTQPTDISRINRRSYWSRSCPAARSSRDESVTTVAASDPAACADRCGVGGLLGGLDSASPAVTDSHVTRSITTRRVCLASDLLDKLKSYQRDGSPTYRLTSSSTSVSSLMQAAS